MDNHTAPAPASDLGAKRQIDTREGVERLENALRFIPAVNIWETDASLAISVDVPGCPADAVNLTVEKNVLTILAQPAEIPGQVKTNGLREYEVGAFERSFTLPDGLDKAAILAKVADGILTIEIPKMKETSQRIVVSDA